MEGPWHSKLWWSPSPLPCAMCCRVFALPISSSFMTIMHGLDETGRSDNTFSRVFSSQLDAPPTHITMAEMLFMWSQPHCSASVFSLHDELLLLNPSCSAGSESPSSAVNPSPQPRDGQLHQTVKPHHRRHAFAPRPLQQCHEAGLWLQLLHPTAMRQQCRR